MAQRRPAHPDWIRSAGDDALVRVHAQTRATSAGVGAVDPWRAALVVRVRAAPEDGRANQEITEILSGALGVSSAAVEIVRGAKSREKEVRVRGCSCERVRLILEGSR